MDRNSKFNALCDAMREYHHDQANTYKAKIQRALDEMSRQLKLCAGRTPFMPSVFWSLMVPFHEACHNYQRWVRYHTEERQKWEKARV